MSGHDGLGTVVNVSEDIIMEVTATSCFRIY